MCSYPFSEDLLTSVKHICSSQLKHSCSLVNTGGCHSELGIYADPGPARPASWWSRPWRLCWRAEPRGSFHSPAPFWRSGPTVSCGLLHTILLYYYHSCTLYCYNCCSVHANRAVMIPISDSVSHLGQCIKTSGMNSLTHLKQEMLPYSVISFMLIPYCYIEFWRTGVLQCPCCCYCC